MGNGKNTSRLLTKAVDAPTPEEVHIAETGPVAYSFEITKVDAEQRTAEGIATAEILDYQGDVITMDCAISAFEQFEKAGAVREMHQPRAVGRLMKWWTVPQQKAIGVQVYISKSRDGEDVLTKLREGILRGFSIGARALDWHFAQFKAMDGVAQTARLVKKMFITELSLVDVPACPKAMVTVVKVDDPTSPAGDVVHVPDPAPQTVELPTSATGDPRTVSPEAGGVQRVVPGDAGSDGPVPSMTKAEALAVLAELRQILDGAKTGSVTSPADVSPVSGTTELAAGKPEPPADVTADDMAKIEAVLMVRGKAAGIGRKDGEPQSPPKGYPTDASDYADPANWSWPMKPAGRARSAISYFNGGKGKDKYTDREWAVLGRRIARMAGAVLGASYKYDAAAKRVVNTEAEGETKMEKGDLPDTLGQIQALIDAACKDLGGPDAASLLEQAAAAAGVAKDVASRAVGADAGASAPSSSSSTPASAPSAPASSGSASPASAPAADKAVKATGSVPEASTAPGSASGGATSPADIASCSKAAEAAPESKETDMDEKTVKELVSKAVAEALAKNAEPVATTPAPASDIPAAAPVVFRKADPMDSPLVKALMNGEEAKVRELAKNSEGFYDEAKLMDAMDVAIRADLGNSGVNVGRLNKWGHDYGKGPAQPGGPDLGNLQALISSGAPITGEMQKSLTTAMNFVGINLERPAKLMLPYIAALRRRIATDQMATGSTQVQWRSQLGFGGWDFSAFGTPLSPVAGNTGVDLAGNASTFAADYRTQALHGEVQFEAIPFAQGFDDPVQIETARGLATLLRVEEMLVLGANEVAIAAPASLTLTQSTLAIPATFPVAGGPNVWTVSVVALTLAGTLNADVTPGLAPNPATMVVGSSLPVTNTCTIIATNAAYIDAYWPAVPGAVGYRVYCNNVAGGGAAEFLEPLANLRYGQITAGAFSLAALGDPIVSLTNPTQTWVGVNHVQIAAAGPVTAFVPPTADDTVNALTFEGLIAWASKTNICGVNLAALGTKIAYDCGGRPLTTLAAGIGEFDNILQQLWVNWHISPTLIICSPQSAVAVSSRLLAANGAFLYRIEVTQERNNFVGGAFVGGYVNKFASNLLTGQPSQIPVWAHPYMPDGSFLFLSERIPYAYSREARGFALDVATPYTYFELARTNRSFPFSLFFIETMKCYHPFAQCIIQGARVDA